jgi:tetratricopeptide (TPR) repeat protein
MKNLSQSRLAAVSLFCLHMLIFSGRVGADPAEVQALIAAGKLDQALTMTDRELGKDANNVSYRFLKGLILTRQEKLDQALAIFTGITRSNPELPEPYNNLAVIYAAKGDFDQARIALEQAINTHPAYATAHENIGDIYAKLASQAYNQALELDRENNTAKAKLSLVNELFSLPQSVVGASPILVADSKESETPVAATPTVPLQTTSSSPVPVLEVSSPPPVQVVPVEQAPQPVVKVTPPSAEAVVAPPVAQNTVRPKVEIQTVAAVKQSVLEWSVAWSAQNINAYLAFYAADFIPPDGKSIEQWRLLRQKRLSQPGSIKVSIADLVVEMTSTTNARATFTQNYQSDVYSDRVKKTLILKLVNNRWLIAQEQTT